MQRCPTCGHENGDRAKFCEECASPLGTAPAAREQRKTVTVLFCDVTGSTALGESTDPEALRALLARYFERMKDIVESHGGTVEKFIGDAVMAVFGVPQVHEDDALRAVRAATEMRAALPDLGVQARIGIDTGEVVTGTEERLATGDAVNVAARLEQAAAPREIGGRQTRALVLNAVETHPLEPLELRKADPVPAYRVVAVREAPERSHESVFVGRWASSRRASDLATGRRRATLPPRHRGGRCRRRQVPADRGVPATGRREGRSRTMSALRERDHVRTGRRGAEATRDRSLRSGGGGLAPLRARRDGGGRLVRGDRLVVSQAAGGAGATGLPLRRHPVGRRPFSTSSSMLRCSRAARRLLLCLSRPELTERRPD